MTGKQEEEKREEAGKSFKKKILAMKSFAAKIPKRGKATYGGNYSYIVGEDVFQIVNKLEQLHRVYSTQEYEVVGTGQFALTKADGTVKPMFWTEVVIVITIHDVDGGEILSFSAIGRGTDEMDKGTGKACTDARKEAWVSFFNTSGSPDIELTGDPKTQDDSTAAQDKKSDPGSDGNGDNTPECAQHGKLGQRKAGISKSEKHKRKAYKAYWACKVKGCGTMYGFEWDDSAPPQEKGLSSISEENNGGAYY